jgi:hypothetical protein
MSNLWAGGDLPLEAKYDGRWTAYVPVWTGTTTNPFLVDGRLSGAYLREGQVVFFTLTLVMGASTTFGSGFWEFTVPIASVTGIYAGGALGYDVSADAFYTGTLAPDTTTKFYITVNAASNAFSPTYPFTWAAGDQLFVSGWYAIP